MGMNSDAVTDVKMMVMGCIGSGETPECQVFNTLSHKDIDERDVDFAIGELLDLGELRPTIMQFNGHFWPALVRVHPMVFDRSRQGWFQFPCSIT
jgi:hypothetical protein